jgi:ABC-2 type transport system permease protein
MSTVIAPRDARLSVVVSEAAKLSAFLRRDLLQALSYRMAFVSDVVGLVFQALLFFYIGKMVNPEDLPTYGGEQVSYLEYVAVGIAITMLIGVGIFRAANAFRNEQLMGTLEALLMTPTAPGTLQLGSVVYDVVYMPVRTAVFFVAIAFAGDVSFDVSGILPATATLLLFIPFVWGLGIMYAAATLTYKAGGGGFAVTLLTITSGAYFPLDLFPAWLAALAAFNPMTIAINTMRDALLGGASWSEIAPELVVIAVSSVVSVALGIVAFRLALRRERRRGSVGLY